MNLIKNNFKIYSNIIGITNIAIIIISLFLFNIFQIPSIINDISLSYNLLLTYSNIYYCLFLFIICLFVLYKCLIFYNIKYYLLVRYSNYETFKKEILKKVFVLISFVFLINFLFSIIISLYDYNFVFSDSDYLFYGIKSSLYSMYFYFRLYFIVIIFSYMACELYSRFKNNISVTLFSIIFIILMFCIDKVNLLDNYSFIFKIFSSYYLEIIDYGSFINENISFIFYEILKIGIFQLLINIKLKSVLNINILKMDIHYIFNKKQNYTLIFIYLVMNILNYFNTQDVNYLLFTFSEEYNFFISNIMNLCSYSSFLCLIYSYFRYDRGYGACFIKTRISQKHHEYIKILIAITLLFLFKIPLYLAVHNMYIIYDFIFYFISLIIVYLFKYLKN